MNKKRKMNKEQIEMFTIDTKLQLYCVTIKDWDNKIRFIKIVPAKNHYEAIQKVRKMMDNPKWKYCSAKLFIRK